MSARLEIERINEMLGITLPESDDYKTLGGLILAKYQSFPKVHEVIDIDNWQCKILKKTKTKIELVKLTEREQEREKKRAQKNVLDKYPTEKVV